AEDGIRDPLVTGVQTCALPISAGVVGEVGPVAAAERVGAAPPVEAVVAVAAAERVRAVAAGQRIGPAPAGQRVVAGAAVERVVEVGRASWREGVEGRGAGRWLG